jgi:hypothetical protein
LPLARSGLGARSGLPSPILGGERDLGDLAHC